MTVNDLWIAAGIVALLVSGEVVFKVMEANRRIKAMTRKGGDW